MPLVQVQAAQQATEIISVPLGAAQSGLSAEKEERYRDLIAFNLDAFFPKRGFKLLATEFNGWEDSKRRIDILACDETGGLVVIELKRDQADAHAELQALRYAALLSVLPSRVIEEQSLQFQIKKGGKPTGWGAAQWRSELAEHLGYAGAAMSDSPLSFDSERLTVILISDSINGELLTTVNWLSRYVTPAQPQGEGVTIECHQLSRYSIAGQEVLHLDKIFPLPLEEDFLVRARQKQVESEEIKTKRPKTQILLQQAGMLKPGARLVLEAHGDLQGAPPQDRIIVYDGVQGYCWLKTGEYFPSLNQLYKKVTGLPQSVQAPLYVRFEGTPKQSLAEIADALWAQQQVASAAPAY